MLKFLLFILLSAMVHIMMFGINNMTIFEINENKEQGRSSLVVELLAKDKQKKSSILLKKNKTSVVSAQVADALKVENRVEKKPIESPKNTTVNHMVTHEVIKKNLLPSLSKTHFPNKKINSKLPNNNEKIKTLLNKAISKYFYYPKSARRKNRQGKVILAFVINNNGLIEHVRVDTSSGYAVLDEAAIKAFKKVEVSESLANIIMGVGKEYTLPIIYKLN